ncbi:hypothetical protein NDU88_005405 [Pleurodeles waltl]|uniref:Uncharacterized protein n=1 Tax=Pleurodeles waltl TaxID=8319 RepID=A0AAV7LP38_PLEWA|nr:hypothetical protein NDU88_005405 [Pleurodeles waltl]
MVTSGERGAAAIPLHIPSVSPHQGKCRQLRAAIPVRGATRSSWQVALWSAEKRDIFGLRSLLDVGTPK